MDRLEKFFSENKKVLLALSGGVDSAYLLHAAKKYGAEIKAYFVKTAFQPNYELLDARRSTDLAGIFINVLYEDVFESAELCENDGERCYYCKRFVFEKLAAIAKAEGIETIIEATNASDDESAGIRALSELNIRSPLRECGITKADILSGAKEEGIHNWQRPTYVCYATQLPSDTPITAEAIAELDRA